MDAREREPGGSAGPGLERRPVVRHAVTIFLSAFLLFQVQPLVSKQILPWFGGTPAVWTTALLFFQLLLLGGYAYAHLASTRLSQRGQVVLHLALLLAALAFLPLRPNAAWAPGGAENPTWRILGLLAVTVGLPYFLLSTTGPLLQAWFSRANPGASPYWLYALSNGGSLLALLTYPFVIEPALALRAQAAAWSWGFVAFAAVCGYAALRTWGLAEPGPAGAAPVASSGHPAGSPSGPPPAAVVRLLWVLLPACGTLMLLAVTNQMCLDVAVVPFLWVVPLSLYLLSFIVCFGHKECYYRPAFWVMLALSMVMMCTLMFRGPDAGLRWQVVGYSAGLFACCMVCHGELVRLKPGPRYLTSFYLAIAAGGALGGLFVTLVAPAIFPTYLELHVGMLLCVALAMAAFWYDIKPHHRWKRHKWMHLWAPGFAALLVLLGSELYREARQAFQGSVWLSRNFYGTLRITEGLRGRTEVRVLQHGRIIHGGQVLSGERRREPLVYFSQQSGVGLAFRNYPRQGPLRVGVVGLGAGVVAAYGQANDHFTFYEINPEVRRLAESHFTYLNDLRDLGGACDVVLGDARLSLARQDAQHFDLLVLDAFSGDAIPIHLLTREAFEIYLRHLRPEGAIALHISNRYLDLYPVALAIAGHFRLEAALVPSSGGAQGEIIPARWVLLSRSPHVVRSEPVQKAQGERPAATPIRLWTDDHSNLFQILR